MPGIPQNILDDIITKIDIVEVISGYIPLKKAGRNFRAVCPFHHEKTPSFMVSPEKQIYHCFGCGAGGNVFSFLMRYDRMEFPEAVEVMARKAGVALPKFNSRDFQKQEALSTQLYRVNQMAKEFYAGNLLSSSGSRAKEYLHKRNIPDGAIDQFGLGLALDKWDALLNFLRSKNIGLSLIEKAGLVVSRSDGQGFYDRFRNRIIFPIYEAKGRVIGFGGRTLDESVSPKYVNSPETQVYVKGRNLFGFNLSRDSVGKNDSVAIVEGYLDFITPYINGFSNIVASLGTALTTEQIRLIKRYTANAVMIYDADKAGELATLRTLDLLIEEDLNVKVVSLGEGLDPDAFIRKQGIEAFLRKVEDAMPLFDYKLEVLTKKYDRKTIEGRANIAREMLITINKFSNEIIKSEYIKQLASELKVGEDSLRAELKKIKQGRSGYKSFRINEPKHSVAVNVLEKMLVKLAIDDNRAFSRLKESASPSDFRDQRLSRLVSIMFEIASEDGDVCISRLINRCADNAMAEFVSELSASVLNVQPQDKVKTMDDCVNRLRQEKVKSRCIAIQEEIKTAERASDEARITQLMEEFRALTKQAAVK